MTTTATKPGEATARPWRLQNVTSARDELVGFTIWEDGASDFPIAGITFPPANLSMMVEEAKANANLIVRAVNEREGLIEALKAIQPLGEAYLEGSPWAKEFDEIDRVLRLAESTEEK